MSRLSRDRLLIAFGPAAVSWIWVSGVIAPHIVAKLSVDADHRLGAESWTGAAAVLGREAEAWRKEAVDATVVLSNDFVRYVIVPPAKGVHGPDEEHALARFHFGKLHGARAKNWEVRLAPGRTGEPRLACAVDAGLLQTLRACFPAKARARLCSVQPYLMAVFNRSRHMLSNKGAWLLIIEPERACLALSTAGTWQAVMNTKGKYPEPETWVTLLERERLRVPVAAVPETVLVCAGSRVPSAPCAFGRWLMRGLAPRPLPGLLPEENERYAMALAVR